MAYAINVADLTGLQQYHPEHAALLLVLKQHVDLDPGHVIECERGKVAGMGFGASVTCSDTQIEAMIVLIRTRLERYRLRIYHSKNGLGGWRRV